MRLNNMHASSPIRLRVPDLYLSTAFEMSRHILPWGAIVRHEV